MLRVRPIHYTSRMDQWERLLSALGMVRTVDDGDWQEFDAGSGRLALHRVAAGAHPGGDAGAGMVLDGKTDFGVEVGDLAEFARRTNAAGVEDGTTPAELVSARHGDTCRITGEDGFGFFADKAAHGAQCADADPALAVVEVWFTPDAAAAAQTLRNMGARLRPAPDDDETADFTAKNGGVLMVRPAGGAARSGLGFEYTGDLSALRDRLAAAGHSVSLTEEAFGRTLHVANPDAVELPENPNGAMLWISAKPEGA
ncbi:VOC family protein [Arthrobacter sp. LAR12-1-1.1]|uniref:VOC family protein n=1 Tax=Arthrobacter sp. LAR12-1-1.1 TaxID=3135215 RepID=UPI003415B35A